MIHWFTRNTQYESPDTVTLLEAILVNINRERERGERGKYSREKKEERACTSNI